MIDGNGMWNSELETEYRKSVLRTYRLKQEIKYKSRRMAMGMIIVSSILISVGITLIVFALSS